MSSDDPILRAHEVGGVPRRAMVEADVVERAAIAQRFDLLALDVLTAAFVLKREAAGIRLTGQVHGAGAQACVASAEPVPFLLTDTVNVLLVPGLGGSGEVELAGDALDVEPLAGDEIDLLDQAAQALGLMLDPYPRLPGAVPGVLSEDEARTSSSPFAVLKRG